MSTVGTTQSPAPARSWLGVGSPGVVGYVLAVLTSAAVLGVAVAVGVVLEDLGTDSSWAVTGVIPMLFFLPLGVAAIALVYGCPAALLGCLLVHFLCLNVRSQAAHVAAAALTGAAAGWAYQVWVFYATFDWLPLQLGAATAIGRAVVIPLARRRR